MSQPLWTIDEIARACGGSAEGDISQPVTGVSIDSRSLSPGDLFVPLSDKRDGHEFVSAAFDRGAAAALVARTYQIANATGIGTLIRVDDPLQALRDLARAARKRMKPETTVVGVTGSVGKTGTKDMLRAAFSQSGPTHAADKSFNNHWGVPLTLARTPQDVETAIYEIGMNHAGEIMPLTKLVQPNIAIVTTVAPVHLEFFNSVEDIAEAKAEIFSGLAGDGLNGNGTAILNRDNAYYDLLRARAEQNGARIISFGQDAGADVRLMNFEADAGGSDVTVRLGGVEVAYRLQVPGKHVALNSLAVIAALQAAGRDVSQGAAELAALAPAQGRGARTAFSLPDGELLLIDESYNANPASMRAALSVLGALPRHLYGRRIAVLGDMLELGTESESLHGALVDCILDNDVDLVFAAGPKMSKLYERVPADRRGRWRETAEALAQDLVKSLQAGDAVMVKGSLGSKMGLVVVAIQAKFQQQSG